MSINFFSEVANRLKQVKPSYLIRAAFDNELETFVLDLVRIDQLKNEGINSEGEVIGFYSLTTEMINPEKVAGTHYTLHDTGYFQKTFELIISNEDIKIWADGSTGKKEDIIDKYGREIIGFTGESVEKYTDQLRHILPKVFGDILLEAFGS